MAKISSQNESEVKSKFGMKPFAFFSGVFDIIISLAIIALTVMLLLQILQEVQTDNADLSKLFGILISPILIILGTFGAIGGLLFLILGILTLVSSFKSDRKNWNGLLIAVTVFDVLLLIPSIFFASVQSDNAQTIGIIFTVVLSLGFVFKIVDIVLTKRRVKKYQEAKMEEYKKTYSRPNFENLNESAQEISNEENASNNVDFSKLGK